MKLSLVGDFAMGNFFAHLGGLGGWGLYIRMLLKFWQQLIFQA